MTFLIKMSWCSRILTLLCICVVLKILIQSLGKYVVNGTSTRVVTVDPEHYEVKNIACNKSRIARNVVQSPHPCSSGV